MWILVRFEVISKHKNHLLKWIQYEFTCCQMTHLTELLSVPPVHRYLEAVQMSLLRVLSYQNALHLETMKQVLLGLLIIQQPWIPIILCVKDSRASLKGLFQISVVIPLIEDTSCIALTIKKDTPAKHKITEVCKSISQQRDWRKIQKDVKGWAEMRGEGSLHMK